MRTKNCKGRKIMSSLIREFYDSEMCEAGKDFSFSEETEKELQSRRILHKRLEDKLDSDGVELLTEYLDACSIVKDDEIFHAYCCGMRDFIRLLASLFDGQ